MTGDFPHGEQRGYSRGCHCGSCRAAHNETQKRGTRARATRPAKQIPHGTQNGYCNYSCRCPACTEANAARSRQYRQRRDHRQSAS